MWVVSATYTNRPSAWRSRCTTARQVAASTGPWSSVIEGILQPRVRRAHPGDRRTRYHAPFVRIDRGDVFMGSLQGRDSRTIAPHEPAPFQAREEVTATMSQRNVTTDTPMGANLVDGGVT